MIAARHIPGSLTIAGKELPTRPNLMNSPTTTASGNQRQSVPFLLMITAELQNFSAVLSRPRKALSPHSENVRGKIYLGGASGVRSCRLSRRRRQCRSHGLPHRGSRLGGGSREATSLNIVNISMVQGPSAYLIACKRSACYVSKGFIPRGDTGSTGRTLRRRAAHRLSKQGCDT